MTSLFDTSRNRIKKQLYKAGQYDESKHPRDRSGKFAPKGGGGGAKGPSSSWGNTATAALIGAGLLGGVAAGVRGSRHVAPILRELVLTNRHRLARASVRNPQAAVLAAALNNIRREGTAGIRRSSTIVGDTLTRAAIGGSVPTRGKEVAAANAIRAATNRYSRAARRRRKK